MAAADPHRNRAFVGFVYRMERVVGQLYCAAYGARRSVFDACDCEGAPSGTGGIPVLSRTGRRFRADSTDFAGSEGGVGSISFHYLRGNQLPCACVAFYFPAGRIYPGGSEKIPDLKKKRMADAG